MKSMSDVCKSMAVWRQKLNTCTRITLTAVTFYASITIYCPLHKRWWLYTTPFLILRALTFFKQQFLKDNFLRTILAPTAVPLSHWPSGTKFWAAQWVAMKGGDQWKALPLLDCHPPGGTRTSPRITPELQITEMGPCGENGCFWDGICGIISGWGFSHPETLLSSDSTPQSPGISQPESATLATS